MTRKSTQLMAIALSLGIMGMAFTCEVVDDDEDVVLSFSWTLEQLPTSEALCSWAGYGPSTVRLMVDTDHDTTEDYYYDADCDWATAQTDPASDPADYAPGDIVWVAYQFIGNDGEVYAQSATYEEVTLVAGVNVLTPVDFNWEDFGNLGILVQWGDKEVDPAYGGCDFPPDAVAVMGYLLSYSTGEVAYEVDIDTDPEVCTTDLWWDALELDTYSLFVDGDSADELTVWGAECADIVVADETDNYYECDILMTSSP